VLDEAGDFASRVNTQMVDLEKLADPDEIENIWKMIQRHQSYTKSERAAAVLADWNRMINRFVKVLPKDYKRVLQKLKEAEEQGLSGEAAIVAAFEANVRDEARIGGG
jgi:glutamate synthase (ferredoxin)